jgi:hypothetical protein
MCYFLPIVRRLTIRDCRRVFPNGPSVTAKAPAVVNSRKKLEAQRAAKDAKEAAAAKEARAAAAAAARREEGV